MFSEEATKIILGLVGALVVLAVVVFAAKRGRGMMDTRANNADKNAKQVEDETLKIMK